MDKKEYAEFLKTKKVKEPRIKNAFIAFIVGGFIGVFTEIISYLMVSCFGVGKVVSYSIACLILILTASIITAIGKFDDLVEKGKCGLIIPTTGFAHSVTSTALEYRKEGMITGIGSNFFKLAGSVILYGIVSSFILCLIGAIIYG